MMRLEDDDYDFRQRVCEWLRANGVDPARTPMDPDASIADGQLTLRQKVQRDGRDVVDWSANAVVTETVTVPVLVQPSAEISEWLRRRCPTCGR